MFILAKARCNATEYELISSAYAPPRIAAYGCCHGLLLWIIEDWPRWAFPSGAYYIDYLNLLITYHGIAKKPVWDRETRII